MDSEQLVDQEGALIYPDGSTGFVAALGPSPREYEMGLENIALLTGNLTSPYGPESGPHIGGDPWEGLQAMPLPRNAAGAPVGDWRYDAFKRRLRSRRGR